MTGRLLNPVYTYGIMYWYFSVVLWYLHGSGTKIFLTISLVLVMVLDKEIQTMEKLADLCERPDGSEVIHTAV